MARRQRSERKKSKVKQEVEETVVSKHFMKIELDIGSSVRNDKTTVDDTEVADIPNTSNLAAGNGSVVSKLGVACKQATRKKKSDDADESENESSKSRKKGTKRKIKDNSNKVEEKVPKLENVRVKCETALCESDNDRDHGKKKSRRHRPKRGKSSNIEIQTGTIEEEMQDSNCSGKEHYKIRDKSKQNANKTQKSEYFIKLKKDSVLKTSRHVFDSKVNQSDSVDVMSVLMQTEGLLPNKDQTSVIDHTDDISDSGDNDKTEFVKNSKPKVKGKQKNVQSKAKERKSKSDVKEKSITDTIKRARKKPVTCTKHEEFDNEINLHASVAKKSKSIQNSKEKKQSKSNAIKKKRSANQVKDMPTVSEKGSVLNHANSGDIMSVLMHIEGPSTSQGLPKVTDDEMMSDSESEDEADDMEDQASDDMEDQASDDSEDEWEEVEDHHGDTPKKAHTPSTSVEITLEAPVIYKKRKKKGFDLQDYLKKQVNKFKKEVALDMHKVHLLCLVSRGFYLNSLCQLEMLKAQVMSIVMVTREATHPTVKQFSKNHVNTVLQWMNKEFQTTDSKSPEKGNTEKRLSECIETRTLSSSTDFTLICVMVLRQIGFMVRLVMSLQPVPYKQAQINSLQKSSKTKKSSHKKFKPSKTVSETGKSESDCSKNPKKTSTKGKKIDTGATMEVSKKRPVKESSKDDEKTGKRLKRICSRVLSKDCYKEGNVEGSDDDDVDDEDFIEAAESTKKCADNKKGKTARKQGKGMQGQATLKDVEKNKLSQGSDGSCEEKDTTSNPLGNDIWLEVYIEAERNWISVCSKCKEICKPAEIRSRTTSPLYYTIGLDNNNSVKDVTIRYACEWLTKTRKLRIEDDWWMETLEPFITADKDRDAAEDKDMQSYLLQRPMPTSISQFKGHPLYILKRHLLKYEALYPNSIVPVGYIRGEPVFSRDCCHTLHSRENWLKEGRSVRLKEEPYKYVKSRKRWNDKDSEPKDCELFGLWQTEIYIPPPAVDGVVPRNAHGNVEMFQPWMLPAGTAHLKGFPGLNRVARKLDIDCAPSMVGWDHHCGFAHPVMDGWIVCEEHKDILIAAWDEEQEIIQQREHEKKEKRVYENWKKLIRGMLIKERLKQRYALEPNLPSTEEKQAIADEPGEEACNTEQSWPRNSVTQDNKTVGIVEKM